MNSFIPKEHDYRYALIKVNVTVFIPGMKSILKICHKTRYVALIFVNVLTYLIVKVGNITAVMTNRFFEKHF